MISKKFIDLNSLFCAAFFIGGAIFGGKVYLDFDKKKITSLPEKQCAKKNSLATQYAMFTGA